MHENAFRSGSDDRVAKVAIGMPVHNGEAFLAQALDSLLAQTFEDFELIISDNASDDGTRDICREYAERDRRIRYVRHDINLGAVPNFNRAFELSRSPFFKWAAHDDVCAPTYLERAVALLEARPEVVWCHSLTSHIGPSGRLLDEPDALDVSYAEREAASASQRFLAVLLDDGGCLDSYGLIRSEFLRRTALYHSIYGAEKVMMAELALLGRYGEVPETLFFARVSAQGSGALRTASEQQAFIDTRAPDRGMVRLRLLRRYLQAIERSAPNAGERLKARLALLRWMLQTRKWGRIALATLRGRGVGSRNVERIEQLERESAR